MNCNIFFLALFALLALGTPASASVVYFEADKEFGGATEPQGTDPWLTVKVSQGTTGSILNLKLVSGLVDDEFISKVFLNFDPDQDFLEALTFQTGSFMAPDISLGQDLFKADGDNGRYDILLDFDTANPGERFGMGAGISFTVTAGTRQLQPEMFDFGNESTKGGPYHVAAHVQGIAGGRSGWIADGTVDPSQHVPEPSTIAVFAFGLSVLGFVTTRRRV